MVETIIRISCESCPREDCPNDCLMRALESNK